MMPSTRESILSALVDAFESSTVIKTVAPAIADVDLTKISKDDLPYLHITVTREEPQYETAMTALWVVNCLLTCFVLSAIEDTGDIEAVIKDVKDTIGNNPTLGGKCIDASVTYVETSGEFPLWRVMFVVVCKYEKGIDNA